MRHRTAVSAAIVIAAFLGAVVVVAAPSQPPTARAPPGAMPPITRARADFTGRVTEVHDVGYVYARLATDNGDDAWVVSLPRAIAVGDVVRARSFGHADAFTSARLGGRTFDRLHFAVVTRL